MADTADSSTKPQIASEGAEVPYEFLEDQPDTLERPAEALLKDALEHNHKLIEVHILRCGAAVEHERTEEHVNEEWIGDVFADDAAGGDGLAFEVEGIVFSDAAYEPAEAVYLSGEGGGNLFDEKVELIGEEQRTSGEGDGRPDLWSEIEVIPGHAELSEEFAERAVAGSGFGVVGDGMETDVVVAAAEAIEGIESADGGVSFEDTDFFFVVRQTHSGGEPGHSGADDDGVVSH